MKDVKSDLYLPDWQKQDSKKHNSIVDTVTRSDWKAAFQAKIFELTILIKSYKSP